MKFSDFNLDERLLEGIDSMGYEKATPVQEQVMQPILDGKDIIASAQTGTGKTAAFLLPVINRLLTEPQEEHQIKALIIVPTRELAVQIEQTLEGLSYFTSVSSIAVYGGGDGINFATEKKALSSGVDIVICTPASNVFISFICWIHTRFLMREKMNNFKFLRKVLKNRNNVISRHKERDFFLHFIQ